MAKKAAIYHFTDKSLKRPKIYKDQLNKLSEFASSLGFDDVDIFCDKSLLRSEHPEFERLRTCIDDYDALITKDFYHISMNTMQCMRIMCELKNKGIPIYTIENGHFCWDEPPFNENLKVATYCCRFGTPNEMKEIISVHNDILSLFVKLSLKQANKLIGALNKISPRILLQLAKVDIKFTANAFDKSIFDI